MNEIIASVVVAAAAVGIAVAGSQRLTREGRLIGRLQRLGTAYALVPASPEGRELEIHVRRAAAELADWIDPGKSARRWVLRLLTAILFAVAVTVLVLISNALSLDLLVTTVLSVLVGFLVGAASLLIAAGLQRFVDRRESERETAVRLELLRKGERPSGGHSE
jgi:hypothetical protein